MTGSPQQVRRRRIAPHRVALGLVTLITLASPPLHGQGPVQVRLDPPPDLSDAWGVRALEDAGMVAGPILDLYRRIEAGELGPIHGVVIARHGDLVAEAYFPGYAFDYMGESFRGPRIEFGPDTPHNLASVTKSVTGLLVGIALDRGDLESVDASVFSFFPEHAALASDGKGQITLGHLLTMTSGLEWNESDVFYGEEENDIVQLFLVPDPIEYILAKGPASPPAAEWRYNGGGTILLGEIVGRASGERLDTFAQAHLFDPLGIAEPEWVRIGDLVYASGNLMLRPRDMAKLGQLVLEGGTWGGKRIVSEGWIEAMTRTYVPFRPSGGYGLHWWIRVYSNGPHTAPAYMADGWGGQRIMVFPTLDLVVVFTGGSYTAEPPLDAVIAHHVLPAVEGSGWE
jgi:CubicO group peptidase (beta-lactamase class C family)